MKICWQDRRRRIIYENREEDYGHVCALQYLVHYKNSFGGIRYTWIDASVIYEFLYHGVNWPPKHVKALLISKRKEHKAKKLKYRYQNKYPCEALR